jgi:hypothetical protein
VGEALGAAHAHWGTIAQALPLACRPCLPRTLLMRPAARRRPFARRGALAAAAPPTKAAPDDALAAFQAEISAIEAEAAAASTADGDPCDGPSTPEELEFEDDDGTWYVWDGGLRKYVPKEGAGAAAPATAGGAGASASGGAAYDVDAMTFAGDDEVLPTLAAAKAASVVAAPSGGGGGEDDEAAAAHERKVDGQTCFFSNRG